MTIIKKKTFDLLKFETESQDGHIKKIIKQLQNKKK